MTKIIFTLFILVHGILHLMGFFKAFELIQINQLAMPISRPAGIFWLITAILFISSALMCFFDIDIWPFVVVIALILSQILIISVWQDAKFGTIANLVILLVCLPALGQYQFHKMVEKEKQMLLQRISIPVKDKVEDKDKVGVANLPPIIRKWLQVTGVLYKPRIVSVQLTQTGKMKTKPGGNWMNFIATQYYDVKYPSFIWTTRVNMMPLIYLDGRDKLIDGEGEMLIKLLSLVKVVNEGQNEKINTGAMLRFLGEIVWFPAAALNDYIHWENIDALTVKATLTIGKESVSGIFRFRDNGDFVSFKAERYFGGGPDAVQHQWVVEAMEYRKLNSYRIPSKAKVTWKLPEGDFTWLELEITDLQYNIPIILNNE